MKTGLITTKTTTARAGKISRVNLWNWLPLIGLTLFALSFRACVPAWGFMWLLAFALFAGGKWLTWWPNRYIKTPCWRHWAYLFLWIGMDAPAFLAEHAEVQKPKPASWMAAVAKIIFGAILLWSIARLAPSGLATGWVGLFGMIFLLHFGLFHLFALAWQYLGVEAELLMRSPMLATSLADFWGRRWNTAFHLLAENHVFRPLRHIVGATWATIAVFLMSGFVHDLLLSFPAQGGYGLPTGYFLLQGMGLFFERSPLGRGMGLRHGMAGWCFTVMVTAGPVFWLFHPAFIMRVIIPFMQTLHAI